MPGDIKENLMTLNLSNLEQSVNWNIICDTYSTNQPVMGQ